MLTIFLQYFSQATYKDKPAAVKVIDLERTSDDYRLKFLPRELYTIKKLKHRYLVQVIDIYVIGNRVLVFMELADGGDFLDLIESSGALTEARARYYYLQFGDGLRYMHGIGFAHRDIKCENVCSFWFMNAISFKITFLFLQILLNKARTHAKVCIHCCLPSEFVVF